MKNTIVLSLITLGFASSLSANLIAYEGFDYGGSDSANLSGMTANGGVGWAGGSSWANGSVGTVQDTTYKSAGLAYDSPTGFDIAGVGGTLNMVNNPTNLSKIGRDLDASLTTGMTVGGTRTLWMSYLYRRDSAEADQTYLSVVPANVDVNQWQNGVFSGHQWKSGATTQDNLVNRPYGFDSGTRSHAITAGETYFVLMKMEFSDALNTGVADTLSSEMWLYESGTDDLPIAAPANVNPAGGTRDVDRDLSDVWFFQASADSGDHSFDELRIGSSFAAVVPEPSAAGLLLGLSSLGWIFCRRRL